MAPCPPNGLRLVLSQRFSDLCPSASFQAPAPNRCWAGDITYIRTSSGWRYLAVWIVLFSRRVIGWKLDHRMDAALVIEALNRALGHRLVEPDLLLIHTDQGSQYRASDYRILLEKHAISCSMSSKGCCWVNAVVESFFSTLKLELDIDNNRKELIAPQQLQRDLAFWIEGYYNRKRRHSTTGYISPIDYEQCTAAHPYTEPLSLSMKSGELHELAYDINGMLALGGVSAALDAP